MRLAQTLGIATLFSHIVFICTITYDLINDDNDDDDDDELILITGTLVDGNVS